MRPVLLNASIQMGMAALRYFLQLYAFKHISLETVGQLALALSFVTSATFVAGFELHQHLNRPLLLGEGQLVRGIGFRAALGGTTLFVLSLLFPQITGVEAGSGALALLFGACLIEYLNLELGRLLIIKGRYLRVASLGGCRALAPFLPALLAPITLQVSLLSWLLVSVLSAAILYHALHVDDSVGRSRIRITRADFAPTARFFLIGGVTAILPLVERLCISHLFGLEALGLYSLIFVFVGVGDLLMQGVIWQPLIRKITHALVRPDEWRRTAALLLAGTVAAYAAICGVVLTLAASVFAFLNKSMPSDALILAVFAYGAARGTFTVYFQIYYANKAERWLPYLQLAIAGGILLSYFAGSAIGLRLEAVLTMAAGVWAVLPLLLLVLFPPRQLRLRSA